MATCKDCIYYEVCKDTVSDENWRENTPKEIKEMFSPKGCENFKNKADFVEVVHCADCTNIVVYDNYCMYFGHKVDDNGFCSYGERK